LLFPVVLLLEWEFFPEFTQVDAYDALIGTMTTYVRTEEHVAVGRTIDLFSKLEDGGLVGQRRVEDGYWVLNEDITNGPSFDWVVDGPFVSVRNLVTNGGWSHTISKSLNISNRAIH
jgi:hypothetical protein